MTEARNSESARTQAIRSGARRTHRSLVPPTIAGPWTDAAWDGSFTMELDS